MAQNSQGFLGFESQTKEIILTDLDVKGEIPSWLSGSFISNGPAQFEVGDTVFNHWFDGFAMLKKFFFRDGRVSFQNRFLHSQQYVQSNASQKLYMNEFATYKQTSTWGRAMSAIKAIAHPERYDNCNVNTVLLNNHLLALTESTQLCELNAEDLSTIGLFSFKDQLKSHLTTAHPHWDPKRREFINVDIALGKTNNYLIYRVPEGGEARELIQTYSCNRVFYMHSFALTEHYVILFKSPLVLNKYKLLLNFPFNDTLSWQANQISVFVLIDRRDGSIQEIETSAFLCFHGVNAYEQGEELIVDLICYEPGASYSCEYLTNLRSPHPLFSSSTLIRHRLNLKNKTSQFESLSSDIQEFPRINYEAKNAQAYSFLYSCALKNNARFFNAIQKTDLHSGKTQFWHQDNYYCGEPVFIAHPNTEQEDKGVLLFFVYNDCNKTSALIILDAWSMQELAEISLPFSLPFGLHGNFYPLA